MAQGAIATIIESWEIMLSILLFLAIGAAIIFVSNTDGIKTQTLANELSYISTIKGNNDYEITVQTDFEIKTLTDNENSIHVEIGEKKSSSKYFGDSTDIKIENNKITIQ